MQIEWPGTEEDHSGPETDLQEAVQRWLETQCSARLPAGMTVVRSGDYCSDDDLIDKQRLSYLVGNIVRVTYAGENRRYPTQRGKNVLTKMGAHFLYDALERNQFRACLDASFLASGSTWVLPLDDGWYACATLDAPRKSLTVDEPAQIQDVAQYALVLRRAYGDTVAPRFDATLVQATQCEMALCWKHGAVELHYADCALVFACDAAVNKIIVSHYFYSVTPEAVIARLLAV